jgi:hypothetical protein
MAGTTGLEPATSAVTGQHSNQLNYVPASHRLRLRAPVEPIVWKSDAVRCGVVGSVGLEPTTFCL